jgi:hypothetical protein
MFSGCMSTRRKDKQIKNSRAARRFKRRQLPHPKMHEAANLRRMYILGFGGTQ